jgi:hypothetical protein
MRNIGQFIPVAKEGTRFMRRETEAKVTLKTSVALCQ